MHHYAVKWTVPTARMIRRRRPPCFRASYSSSSLVSAIPTRHSLRGPPPICKDPMELQELTQQILDTPVGSLYCQNTKTTSSSISKSISEDRDEAYATAQHSSQMIEYLLRGYNHQIPGTLYGKSTKSDTLNADEASACIGLMMDILERFDQEGKMYLKLRQEALNFQHSSLKDTVAKMNESVDIGDRDSSSSSSDSSDEEEEDEEIEIGNSSFGEIEDFFSSVVQHKHEHAPADQNSHLFDFASPGVTTFMYDATLDTLACAAELVPLEQEPEDLYQIVLDAIQNHELNNPGHESCDNKEWFPYTIPTMATYNAALRGIGSLCLAGGSEDAESQQRLVDQGLAYGFGVYNHLTHNKHALPKRNSASIIYLLRVVKACLPPSRVRGNITVTLWCHASREGLVTGDLIAAIRDVHNENNGPEFDVFLESLAKCEVAGSKSEKVIIMPQRFARFVKKYQHSSKY